MDAQHQVRINTPSRSPTRRRIELLALLLVGVSAVALLGTRTLRDREHERIEAVGNAVKTLAAIATPTIIVSTRPDATARSVSEPSAQDVGSATASAPLASDGLQRGPRQPETETKPYATDRPFGIGDRLKITFYERMEVEDDKWARTSSALRGIQQRPELSGEYTIQEDGTISVPMLGSIPAARSERQVQAALTESFEQILGRKGMVNVVLLERSPVYVLGPVKNPGSYKYVPGMTVLHAIALAGGIDRAASEPWQKVEAVREIQKRSGALDSMLRLLAREAVLKAERDGTSPKIPLRLLSLVGATEAASLLNEQSDRRKAVAMARKDRERAVLGAAESAKQDLLMYARTDSLDELVKTRQERVENTRALIERNVVGKAVLSQVQSELSEAEQRRQDAFNQYAIAKQRLATLEADALRVRSELTNDLAVEIEATERQIIDTERELETSEGVLRILPATRDQFAAMKSTEAGQVTYRIVRQTPSGPVSVESGGLAVLQPGDLVEVVAGTSDMSSKEPPVERESIIPGSHHDRETPIKRAATQQETGRAAAQD